MNILQKILIVIMAVGLTACNTFRPLQNPNHGSQARPVSVAAKAFSKVPAPAGPPVIVAVYGFKDLTGQRKSSSTVSSFSTAVTQGADAYLVKTMMDVGNSQWFTVVERVGLDNLLKERQMIKQTREIYEGDKARMLPPMSLAGVIVEGGIVDYNSNILTGGTGARMLGIGPYTKYSQDVVVINLRLVSVSNGEVLLSVTIEKNLLSTNDSITALKFFNQSTEAFEFDSGQAYNEPANYALRSAIEQGVVELIKQGEKKGLWKYKSKDSPITGEVKK
jgi:curli production assembly/transport component CsgG